VRRWAAEERAAGRPWRPEAGPANTATRPSLPREEGNPEALRARLRERLDYLVAQSELNPDDPKIDDRMLKVCRVLEHLQDDADLDAQLETIRRFAAFCVRNLPESTVQPLRSAIRLFVEDLKEEHS
jgi:hypothetical protein